jgi:hypothetical protein
MDTGLAPVNMEPICNKEIPRNASIIPVYNEWVFLVFFSFHFGYRYRWVFLRLGLVVRVVMPVPVPAPTIE